MKSIKQVRECQIPKQKNLKIFHWDIITICNYHCEYCYSRANEGQWNKITNQDKIDQIISTLKEVNHPIEVALLGGEPTKHPKYFYIIEQLNKLPNFTNINIFSNGDVSKEKILKHPCNTIFNITYHASQVKDIEEFKETCLLIKRHFQITITVLFENQYLSQIMEVLQFCKEYNFVFYINLIFHKTDYYKLNEEERDNLNLLNNTFHPKKEMIYIGEQTEYLNDIDVYLTDRYHFKNWICKHNYYYIPVNDTRIKQLCTEREITINEINTIHEIKCPLENCLCAGNLTDEKYKE